MTKTPTPWTTTASIRLVHDQWIGLRADTCLADGGVEVSPYYVLEYPDWVHVVALSPEGLVMLVRQYRHGLGAITLELPAGKLDPGDAGPEAAALRELREETGCAGAVAAVLPVLSPNPATHANRIHTVLVRDVRPVAAPTDDPREVVEPLWVTVEEALRRLRAGEISASLQISSLLLGLAAAGALVLEPAR